MVEKRQIIISTYSNHDKNQEEALLSNRVKALLKVIVRIIIFRVLIIIQDKDSGHHHICKMAKNAKVGFLKKTIITKISIWNFMTDSEKQPLNEEDISKKKVTSKRAGSLVTLNLKQNPHKKITSGSMTMQKLLTDRPNFQKRKEES